MAITDHWYAFKDMIAERRLGAYGESLSIRPVETTISTTWEPSAELNAVMAQSGARTNAGYIPPQAAANDGMHLLTQPLDMKAIIAELRDPDHVESPAMRAAMDALRKFRDENAKLKDAGKVWEQNRARMHHTKAESQQRDAAFWQRTLDVGRRQRLAGQQMTEPEREAPTVKG